MSLESHVSINWELLLVGLYWNVHAVMDSLSVFVQPAVVEAKNAASIFKERAVAHGLSLDIVMTGRPLDGAYHAFVICASSWPSMHPSIKPHDGGVFRSPELHDS